MIMKTVEDRFWSKVYIDTTGHGCWEWMDTPHHTGYGHMRVGNSKIMAHRLSYALNVGEIPQGLHLDHGCRNRSCVRPDHLEPVTNRENILRGTGPSAMNAQKTLCPNGHKYDMEEKGRHGTARRCGTCRRESNREAVRRYRARQ